MSVKSFSFVVFFGLFHLATLAFAEQQTPSSSREKGLYLCSGVWSAKACDEPESVLPYRESTYDRNSPEEIRKREVQRILHPIRIKASEIGNTYRARYDISMVEKLCNDPFIPITDCVDATLSEHEKLLNYEIKLREQDLRLREMELERDKIAEMARTNEQERQNQRVCDNRVGSGWGLCGPRVQPGGIFISPRPGGPSSSRPPSGPHLVPRANPGQTLSIPSIKR